MIPQDWKIFALWSVVLPYLCASESAARGVAPYLSEKLSPVVENEVERLAVIAGIPNLTRPYNLATIFHYLEEVRTSHPMLYSRLRLALNSYARKFALTHAKLTVSDSDEQHPLPNGRGNTADALLNLSIRGQWQIADWFALYAGADITEYRDSDDPEDNMQASGSIVSMGLDWAQLDVGYRDIWLSPFQGSAQLLSTHAETMPSISLSNNLPIEFLGSRWNYLAFLAEMSKQPVLFNNQLSSEDPPLLAGLHISVQPTPWWSLGVNRVFQFGGGERPVDFKTLMRAFFNPRDADNDAPVDEESGNQIASIVSKINFDGQLPFSFAVELAGEDTSNNKSYQLGNTAVTAGLFFPYFFSRRLSLTYEYSDWQDAWYVNNVYTKGYTNEDFVLGHWALQVQRDQGTAVEGSSHFLSSQWQTPKDHFVSALVRFSDHQDTANVDFEQAWEVELGYTIPLNTHLLTLGAYWGNDALGDNFTRVKMSFEW